MGFVSKLAVAALAPNVASVHGAPAADWKQIQDMVKSVGRTERGTISVAQMKIAARSLEKQAPPGGVGNYIKQQLLPQAEQTKLHMQSDVDAAVQKVKDCGILLWSAEKETEHREQVLMEDESGAYQCVAQQHQLYSVELANCGNLQHFVDNLVLPRTILETNKTPSAMKETITKSYEFYNNMYPEYMSKKGACVSATQAADQQLAECEVEQHLVEEFYCKMKAKRDEACDAYDSCYDQGLVHLHTKVSSVQQLEQHVKEDFQSMSCFGDALGDDASSASDASAAGDADCDPNAYDTAHLNVVYPPDPIRETCIALAHTKTNHSSTVCDGATVISSSAFNATVGSGTTGTPVATNAVGVAGATTTSAPPPADGTTAATATADDAVATTTAAASATA